MQFKCNSNIFGTRCFINLLAVFLLSSEISNSQPLTPGNSTMAVETPSPIASAEPAPIARTVQAIAPAEPAPPIAPPVVPAPIAPPVVPAPIAPLTKHQLKINLDSKCVNTTMFLNSTEVLIADMEFYAKSLRNLDQLHHTDKCDPDLDDNIHTNIWALEKTHVLTFGKLHELSCGMKQTCPGGRNMMCDPTRKRCVCRANSFWLPLTATERLDPQLNMNKGRCYLKVGSKCEDQNNVAKKMEQLVCVEHSQCKPIKMDKDDRVDNKTEMQCQCELVLKQTLSNGSMIPILNQPCYDAIYKQDVQLKALIKRASEMRWRSFGEECTRNNAIDTRIHTLRSIDVKLNREWTNEIDEKYLNGSSERCNFAKNLNCNNDQICVCKSFYSWDKHEDTCVGEEGAFCEMRFWGESDTVGIPMKCNKDLSCIVAQHPDTKKDYHVCCYIRENSYRRTLTYADYHMCQMDVTGYDEYEDATATRDPVKDYMDGEDDDEDDPVADSGNGSQSKIVLTSLMLIVMCLI